ncbi:aspartate/glutamate racemase family protein [Sunxiuqinia dokdonensis]|uniref:Aspartate racemase n=1 Tax=Sunxiuqinia dokdonensis TaxID=1409788 RepID=A0A0L8V3A3_9BACT|nr:aspartate/glutamate racemase family protein [Sunxiuqinia dokdonensis]KOH42848.1 aspartate racemase [Sunxiuqinia dokdonensis]
MKTIGLVGGTGWVSTMEYYRLINLLMNEKKGGLHAARIIIYSLNFGEIEAMQQKNDKLSIMLTLKHAALKLEAAGADCVMLGANTMHQFADDVQQALRVPLLHIAEATASTISQAGLRKVGLLGTKYTMELDFYKEKLAEQSVDTLIPEDNDRTFIQHCIMHELVLNQFLPESKARFLSIIQQLQARGAEGIILGCTEIPLLIEQTDCDLPLFNTTEIHARAAVEFSY